MSAAAPVSFHLQNLSCGGCVGRAARALESVDGIADVRVNLADETAQVTMDRDDVPRMLSALETAGYPAAEETVTFDMGGMTCGSCVGRVEQAFAAVPGVLEARANLADETAVVRHVPGLVTVETLLQVAQSAGYPAKRRQETDRTSREEEKQAETETLRRAVLLSAALTLPVFVLEMGGHMVPAFHHFVMATLGQSLSWAIQFALTTIVLVGPGRRFFSLGVPALLRRAPDMNSLVSLGAGAAWGYSTVALLMPQIMPEGAATVYFEAAAVIVTLILLGRWLEARAKAQTGAAIRKLIGLQPRTAWRQDGADWVEVPLDQIAVGDVLMIRPGARVPLDMRVQEGSSAVDESMITGEPVPVQKAAGAALTGGTVNGTGSLTGVVTHVGADTVLSQIIRMVQQAQGAKLPIQGLVDRITLWFVPLVLAVAAVTIAVWLWLGPAPSLAHALVAGVSVLIIACPCAMGLATPTSIMVGTGRAAQLGVLFRHGDGLQMLDQVTAVAFDKTGTLTRGKPEVTAFEVAEGFERDDVLALAAAVETQSEHVLAQAILRAAEAEGAAKHHVTDFQAIVGRGATGLVQGRNVAVGNAALMASKGADVSGFAAQLAEVSGAGATGLYVAIDGRIAAFIGISDPIKPEAAEVVAHLKDKGVGVAMFTGDAEATARAVAAQLGIDEVRAGLLPADKVAALQRLKDDGYKVAFVGDGINDAPVLALADVGVAIGTGTDVAIETADVVLMSGDVTGVARAIAISRQTLRNIRQNLFWAFGYNVLLIPVAAGLLYPFTGWLLSPALAAGAMALSSVFVVTNALRLRNAGGEP